MNKISTVSPDSSVGLEKKSGVISKFQFMKKTELHGYGIQRCYNRRGK